MSPFGSTALMYIEDKLTKYKHDIACNDKWIKEYKAKGWNYEHIESDNRARKEFVRCLTLLHQFVEKEVENDS